MPIPETHKIRTRSALAAFGPTCAGICERHGQARSR